MRDVPGGLVTRRSERSAPHGYFGVGVERSKTEANVGTLWRSAFALGASFVFTVGKRYPRQSTDTTQAWRHIPLLEYADVEDLRRHVPYDCQVVGVEIAPDAVPLETFVHPSRAIYLLGPEDGSLSRAAMDICQRVVQFDSSYCLNVAAAGTVVLYDRSAKRARKEAP